MNELKGTCDECGKEFNVQFKQKHHPEKIIETYFKCKHCKKRYFCFATDPEVRKMQQEIKSIESPFLRLGMQQKINARMKKIKGEIAK
jgi:hypothetical protein